MSEDHKKNSDTPAAKTSMEPTSPLASHTFNKGLKIALLVTGLAVVACTVWLLVAQKTSENNAVFIIEGKEYSPKEVDGLIEYPTSTGTSKNEASEQAYEYLKRQTAAKKVGFEPTSQEITTAKNEVFATADDKEKNSRWAELVAYDTALEKKLPKSTALEDAKGYVFVFYFGNLIESGDDYQPENLGNKDMIAADKKYAKDQADSYRKQLQDKKISPDELLAKINADPKLNYQYIVDNNRSVRLDSPAGKYASLQGDIENFVAGDAPIGVSQVKVGSTYKVTDHKNPGKMKAHQTYYYFTDIQDKGNSAKTLVFNNTYSKLSAEYKGYK